MIAVGVLLLAAALCYGIYFDETGGIDRVRFVMKADGAEQRVGLYECDGVYYAFLPSYADPSALTVECDAGSELYLDGKALSRRASDRPLEPDREYALQLKNGLGITVADSTLVIKQARNIPALSIRLQDSTLSDIHTDKSISKSGKATLVTQNGTVAFSGNIRQLHGRGNTTWEQPKKSYTMELAEKADLLGMGAAKNWVLQANSFDESGLRNKLVYDFARELGVEYAVDCEYIDLYVDDVYCGLYLLCEKPEVGENRVEITDLAAATEKVNPYDTAGYPVYTAYLDGKLLRGYSMTDNPADITGGYLIQAEHHDDRIRLRESVFFTDELSFSLTSPKYASREQIQYIAAYVNRVEDALARGDLSDIDVESFARYYLVQELFANNDNCSVYYYKDTDAKDQRLHACAIWDFDQSIGNSWLVCDMNPRAMYRHTDNWFDHLTQNPEFSEKLRAVFADEVLPRADALIGDRIERYCRATEASFVMDRLRWKNVKGKNDWTDRSQRRFGTLAEHADAVRRFMSERLAFLKEAWVDGMDYCTVSFTTYENTDFRESYSVVRGERLDAAPDPTDESTADYTFLGWYDEAGSRYTPGEIVSSDAAYTARWQAVDSGAAANLKNKLKKELDWIEYDVGLITVALIAVFAAVGLALFVGGLIGSRRRRRRGK